LALTCVLTAQIAGVGEDEVRDYDYTVYIETRELTDVLRYVNSPLRDPIKVSIKYAEAGQTEEDALYYEDFWYRKGKPYGQEKHRKLDIPPGKAIAFRVVHKDGDTSEERNRAAANAIVRVFVDVAGEGGLLTAVKVPGDSYASIISHIEELNFQPAPEATPDQPTDTKVNLFIVSQDDDSVSQTLNYMN